MQEALRLGLLPRLDRGERVSFVTLTAPGLESVGQVRIAFSNLVRGLRDAGVSVEYCGVIARGRGSYGLLHVHLVWSTGGQFIPQAWVRSKWERLVGYGLVNLESVQAATGERVTRYVLKNIGGYMAAQGSSRRLESTGWRVKGA